MHTAFLFLLLIAENSQPVATLPVGTRVEAKLQSEVNTGRSRIGDSVTAIVTVPLRTSNKVVVPGGSHLNGRIETIQRATRSEEGRVRLVFREIEFPDGRRVSTWITSSFGASPPKRTLRYVLCMAAGAAGGLIGGTTARLAGILGGTLAGFVVAGSGDDSNFSNVALHSGQMLHLQFGEDLVVPEQ